MNLHAFIEEQGEAGRPIGFYPWRDLDGMLWGRLTGYDPRAVWFQKVGSDGEDDGEEGYYLSDIHRFDVTPAYAWRLEQLECIRPERTKWTRHRSLLMPGAVIRLKFSWGSSAALIRWATPREVGYVQLSDDHKAEEFYIIRRGLILDVSEEPSLGVRAVGESWGSVREMLTSIDRLIGFQKASQVARDVSSWGRVLSVGRASFRYESIDMYGKPEGVRSVKFKDIVSWDTDAEYAARLEYFGKLGNLGPGGFRGSRQETYAALEASVGDPMPLVLRLEAEKVEARVVWVDGTWVGLRRIAWDEQIVVRRERVKIVRYRDAMTEALASLYESRA